MSQSDCEQLEFLLRGREDEVQSWMRKASDYLSRAERAETEAGDLRRQLISACDELHETRDMLGAKQFTIEDQQRQLLTTERELAETRSKLEEMTAWHARANEHRLEALRDRRLALVNAGACTPAERAVLDELANAKIVAACNRGVRCCAKFEEPYEKYVCSKELARRGSTSE